MALRKRVTDARQFVLCTAIEAIDPAIDVSKSNLKAYWDSLFAPEHLKFIEGQEPTKFTIRPMKNRAQMEHLDALGGVRGARGWYIRCCCIHHANYSIVDDAGVEKVPAQPDMKPMGDLGEVSSAEWLDGMHLAMEWERVLTEAAYKLSEAAGPLSMPSAPQSGQQSAA